MKRVISIAVSLAILGLIYWRIDVAGMLAAFAHCQPGWMGLALAMVIPTTLLTAYRLKVLAPAQAGLGLGEAVRLTLAASVLNMVLPSKMGDLAKSWFMKEKGQLSGGLALSLVVFEKTCDMLSLLAWCVFGLLMYPEKGPLFWGMTALVGGMLALGLLLVGSAGFAAFFFRLAAKVAPGKISAGLLRMDQAWREMHGWFWRDPSRLAWIVGISLFIWFLHLVQIWMFIRSLQPIDAELPVTLVTSLGLTPLAILAGLAPLTFAGVGVRDGALIYFYQGWLSSEVAAAVGLMCTVRYILPAIGGLPFFSQYLGLAQPARAGLKPTAEPPGKVDVSP